MPKVKVSGIGNVDQINAGIIIQKWGDKLLQGTAHNREKHKIGIAYLQLDGILFMCADREAIKNSVSGFAREDADYFIIVMPGQMAETFLPEVDGKPGAVQLALSEPTHLNLADPRWT